MQNKQWASQLAKYEDLQSVVYDYDRRRFKSSRHLASISHVCVACFACKSPCPYSYLYNDDNTTSYHITLLIMRLFKNEWHGTITIWLVLINSHNDKWLLKVCVYLNYNLLGMSLESVIVWIDNELNTSLWLSLYCCDLWFNNADERMLARVITLW
jgi:hypothetical protein